MKTLSEALPIMPDGARPRPSRSDLSNMQQRGFAEPVGGTNAKLAKMYPAEADKTLTASLQKQGVQLIPSVKYNPMRVEVQGLQISKKANLEKAAELVARSLMPAPPEMIVAGLMQMHLTMASKASDTEGRMREVARALGEYPADLVMTAIRSLQRTHKFFPSLSEFIEHLEPRYERRKRIEAELEKERRHWTRQAERG